MVYFIILPLQFVYHAIHHQNDDTKNRSDGLECAQFTSDCTLCDVYYSQTAIIETSCSYVTVLHSGSFRSLFTKDLVKASEHLNFQRGPPVS